MSEPENSKAGNSEKERIGDLLLEVVAAGKSVDLDRTSEVLGWMWRAFCTAGAAGHVLSVCAEDPDFALLFHNANPVLGAAVASLRSAPSLPVGLDTEMNVAGGPDEQMDAGAAIILRDLILVVSGQINILSGQAAQRCEGADARACQDAEILSSELHDCYTGRLRSFLNDRRTSFGPGSFRVSNARRR